jgi:hypothetical protein
MRVIANRQSEERHGRLKFRSHSVDTVVRGTFTLNPSADLLSHFLSNRSLRQG